MKRGFIVCLTCQTLCFQAPAVGDGPGKARLDERVEHLRARETRQTPVLGAIPGAIMFHVHGEVRHVHPKSTDIFVAAPAVGDGPGKARLDERVEHLRALPPLRHLRSSRWCMFHGAGLSAKVPR